MLLHDIIDNAAAARPGGRALVDRDRTWSFAELAECVHGLARWIRAAVGPGGRVAIVSENNAEYVMALYGVPAAACTLVHCNTRHTPSEIATTIERSGASVLLGSPEQLTRLAAIDLPGVEHRVGLAELPTGETSTGPRKPVSSARETDMAWLMYTSGTTGRPKGVVLTHRSLLTAALNTTMCRHVAEDEVYLYPFPLFHVAAYNVVHLHLRQRPVVLLDRFEPAAAFDAIGRHSVTSVSLAPTMLAMMLDHPGRDDSMVATLRSVSYGAAAMPLELMRRSLREWPEVGLAQGYGMTELSGNAVFLSPEDHRLAAGERPDLLSAAGRPAPLTSLRIVGDDGSTVAAGEAGEILVRGDQVCGGYLDDPAANEAAFTDGWLHTGDIGRLDEEGYLHVVDRLKDIIITGGENVSSREVEDAVSSHPNVASVAVVGTPDDRWGELVTAAVVVREGDPPTPEQLRELCSHLAGFKHPRRVVAVHELPTNASGKVDKVALRSLIAI